MNSNDISPDPSPPTYLEIIVEAKCNPTETKNTIQKILNKFLDGPIIEDERSDGFFLVKRASNISSLQLIGDWIREQKLLDTVRSRLFRSILNNITAIYFNKQAAMMNKLSLIDFDDKPPNGPISFQLVSDNLNYVIDILSPKTFKGKEIS